ncbi:unnamed protein product [Sphagnum troendelagicum]|uniref:Uncharacterized protein n=1 Tax=Sphagnum troendelagicum TaxID=128251 RepID=A0ABP0UNN7_9BRYO
MCKQSSWLNATVTLPYIKEEVLDIVLDLLFWKRMLKIATAHCDKGGLAPLQYATKALGKDEELHEKLLKADSPLQKAAYDDRSHLLNKLLEVKERHASGREGSTASIHEREYILSIYLLSYLQEEDRIATEVESQLRDLQWGNLLSHDWILEEFEYMRILLWTGLPIREPQAAGSAGDSYAGKTGGLQKTPVDVRQHQQQDPVFPGGLTTQICSLYFGATRNPIQSPIQIPLVKQNPQLMAPEEERKQFMPHEEDMNLQINKLRQEKEKLLDQILLLERQLASKNLQGQSYLDDSKTATPALLATAIDTVRDIGEKFTKELMDQLKKCPENIRLAVEDHILKQVAVVVPKLTHRKFQYQAYMNHKLFIGFDPPTFFMSIDDVDEPPLEFSEMQKSEWLAFAFETPVTTFVVAKGLPFDPHKMQSAGPPDDITPNSRVGLLVLPGFQANESIIHCQVYLVEQ